MKKLLLSFLLSGLAAGAAHAQNYAIVTSDVADMKLDKKALRAMKTDNAGQILKDFQEQPAAEKETCSNCARLKNPQRPFRYG